MKKSFLLLASPAKIGYNESMIQVSETIASLKQIVQESNSGVALYTAEFHRIMDEIHLALDNQDSDTGVSVLIHGALSLRASDIHLEIHENESTIRFRIDGSLAPLGRLSIKEHTMLAERMKYRASLKLNIHNIPQDGKIRLWKEGKDAKIDIRVSVMPTRYGESIVCRVLDASTEVPNMDGLGILLPQKEGIQNTLQKKQGMILVTGPTWSGKTTTLYSLIEILRQPADKIITLEDPIEYQIPDVLQSEINEHDGYTFAMWVRSVLRHDPDIIMVGEIRDLDTATAAVQAALTGHLVLSTLHTKSAIETIERLMNIGVSDYDIASALDCIVAQRLVRRVCPDCWIPDEPIPLDETLFARYGVPAHPQHGKWCQKCGNTGFFGRIGIYEVLQINDNLRDAIRAHKPETDLFALARKNWFITLAEDALAKIALGMTTFEECRSAGVL